MILSIQLTCFSFILYSFKIVRHYDQLCNRVWETSIMLIKFINGCICLYWLHHSNRLKRQIKEQACLNWLAAINASERIIAGQTLNTNRHKSNCQSPLPNNIGMCSKQYMFYNMTGVCVYSHTGSCTWPTAACWGLCPTVLNSNSLLLTPIYSRGTQSLPRYLG